MRKSILLLLALFFSNFLSHAMSGKPIMVSLKMINNKPLLVYANFNDKHFISIRKGNETLDYELKSVGSEMVMGQVAILYQAYINCKLVKGLQFRTVFGEVAKCKPINYIDIIIDEKEHGKFDLKEV